jgi:tetratricopeptide (TPR) repeat protein
VYLLKDAPFLSVAHSILTLYTYTQYDEAVKAQEQSLAIMEEVGDRRNLGFSYSGLANCYFLQGQIDKAITLHQQALSIAQETNDRVGQGHTYGSLGICHTSLGQYTKAIELHEQYLAIAKEVGDTAGQGQANSNLGLTLAKHGDAAASLRALVRGLVAFQSLEQNVGAHDDRRISIFEEQQKNSQKKNSKSANKMLEFLSKND